MRDISKWEVNSKTGNSDDPQLNALCVEFLSREFLDWHLISAICATVSPPTRLFWSSTRPERTLQFLLLLLSKTNS